MNGLQNIKYKYISYNIDVNMFKKFECFANLPCVRHDSHNVDVLYLEQAHDHKMALHLWLDL